MKVLKNTLIIVNLTLAVCLFLEFTSYLALKKIQPADHVYQHSYMTGYVYDPYVAFRSHNFPAQGSISDIGPESMVITGGSTAIGIGVQKIEDSYYKVFEKYANATPELNLKHVINFAVPGYVSNQEAITYKNHVFTEQKATKILLSFTGFNDLYFYLYRTLDIGNHEFSYAIDLVFRKGYPEPILFSEKIKNFVRKTNIFTLLHSISNKDQNGVPLPIRLSSNIIDPFQPQPTPPTDERVRKAAEHFLKNCLSTALLAKHRGTKYVVLLQPNYYYGGELTVKNNEWFDKMEKLQDWINSVARHKNSYDLYYQLILSGLNEMEKKGLLDVLDYRDVLKDAGKVYLDPVHFNEEGSLIVAEKMLADIKKILKK